MVTCLNSYRKITLKFDEAAAKFISGWIVPLIKMCASLRAPSQDTLAPSQAESHGFQLNACPTPSIRDKVYWNPTAHTWQVLLKLPAGQRTEDFTVEPDQSAEMYEKEKSDKYWRAVATWNRLDSSNRFRIPTTRLPIHLVAN